jgi:hypothetical protein
MLRRLIALLVFILVFSLVFPGVVLAQDSTIKGAKSSAYTIVIETPEQGKTGQTLTLITQVLHNEYFEPVEGARVNFFVKSDFFISDLVEIGAAVTDEKGFAKIDYISNQPGDLVVVASYKPGSNIEPIVVETMVNISGSAIYIYQSDIGIPFPNTLLLWLISIIIILSAVWGAFLYILTQVLHISRGTGVKGASITFTVVVAILFIVIVLVLITPEAQFNFGLLP